MSLMRSPSHSMVRGIGWWSFTSSIAATVHDRAGTRSSTLAAAGPPTAAARTADDFRRTRSCRRLRCPHRSGGVLMRVSLLHFISWGIVPPTPVATPRGGSPVEDYIAQLRVARDLGFD